MEKERVPWWLWPNLLSLDAPLVAIGWAWLFSRAWGVISVPWQLWVTLGLAVWMIYALDRLVDAKRGGDLDRRHHFHARFSRIFMAVIFVAGIFCLHSVMLVLQKPVFQYGLLIIGLSAGYFVIVWTQKRNGRPMIGKNIVAGLTFAYGASAGIHAYSPVLEISEMFLSTEVLLFGGLCVINMTAIDFLSLEGEEDEDAAAVLNLATLLVGGMAAYMYLSSLKRDTIFFHESFYHEQTFYKPFAAGVLVGSACFFLLNQARRKMDQCRYRVLVDLAVLAPVIVFWVMNSIDPDPYS